MAAITTIVRTVDKTMPPIIGTINGLVGSLAENDHREADKT